MKSVGRTVTTVVIVAIVVVIAFFAVRRVNKPAEEIIEIPLPAVEISTPQIGSIELSTGLTGTIEAADSVYVIAKGSGEVVEVYVSQGDTVEKGQELLKIDNETSIEASRLTLEQLQMSIDDAQTNVNRMAVLYESGDISAQSYEQVVSALNQAKLQYDSAKLSYDSLVENSVVTAPISGVLEQFSVDVHDMVSGGSVGVISGFCNKVVSFSVTERVYNGLSVGDEVIVEKNGMEYTGEITEMATMVDAATGLFKVKASLDAADALPTGTMVKIYVVSQKAENVMTVPVDCVNYYSGDAYVYVYNSDGTVSEVQIEQGLIDSDKIQVVSGLDWTDEVVVSWSKEIYDGAEVRIATTDAVTVTPAETAEETVDDESEVSDIYEDTETDDDEDAEKAEEE